MSTAGARHCADLNGTFAGEEYAPSKAAVSIPSKGQATAPLFECAIVHEQTRTGVPLETLALILRDALYGE